MSIFTVVFVCYPCSGEQTQQLIEDHHTFTMVWTGHSQVCAKCGTRVDDGYRLSQLEA